MSPERIDAEMLARRMSAHEQETILLTVLYFGIKFIRREATPDWYHTPDPEKALNELLEIGYKPGGESTLAMGTRILKTHPMRPRLFPALGDGYIDAILGELDQISYEQEQSDLCEDPEPRVSSVPIADVALSEALFTLGANAHVHNRTPLLINDQGLDPEDARLIAKAIVSRSLPKGIRGFLGAGETPESKQPPE